MKLSVKDLISIGLFTAIYFVCFFVVGMIGFIPYFMILMPVLASVIGGIPILSMISKVGKFGVLTISGTLVSFLMFLTGHGWTTLAIGIPLSVLADVIASRGNYQNWKALVGGYLCFSLWVMGPMLPLFFMKEAYFKTLAEGYGSEYASILNAITPVWMFPVMVVSCLVGALLGAYLGRAVLKKHFLRAGIV